MFTIFILPLSLLNLHPRLSLKHVAEAGSIAEEVISTIRTAQAFGTQKVLSGIYNERMNLSLRIDLKMAAVHGSALSVFFFVIYSGYALGMLSVSSIAVILTTNLPNFSLQFWYNVDQSRK